MTWNGTTRCNETREDERIYETRSNRPCPRDVGGFIYICMSNGSFEISPSITFPRGFDVQPWHGGDRLITAEQEKRV
jgi:hypothetical protein